VGEEKRHAKEVEEEHKKKTDELREQLTEALSNILLGEKIPLDVVNSETEKSSSLPIARLPKRFLRKLARFTTASKSTVAYSQQDQRNHRSSKRSSTISKCSNDEELERAESGEALRAASLNRSKFTLPRSASCRSVTRWPAATQQGRGRKIVAEEDMPFSGGRNAVDIVLNPLGVPSRHERRQVLETHLAGRRDCGP